MMTRFHTVTLHVSLFRVVKLDEEEIQQFVHSVISVIAVQLTTLASARPYSVLQLDRAFSVSGPQTWNQLPEEITSATSLSILPTSPQDVLI